ncbi:MAG: Na(+)-translocating NADH-quinone reductase subunit A [Bacteroidales bacterium]|nr:Na(+)-translocating NADH-quinone reductase subunit A [Bacteroidales bacterium]
MSDVIKIKKGLTINLLGEAEKTITEINPKYCAIKPTDFIGLFPKLLVQEGDPVKAGTPLFFDKYRDRIYFTSPVSGTVKELRRGEKRVLLEVVIESDGKNDAVDFGRGDPNAMSRDEITGKLLKSGLWPMIRQRPYSVVAEPSVKPKAIFISAFDTAPLAPDYDLVVHGCGEAFQAGIDALVKLTDGTVHLNISADNTPSKVFTNCKGARINKFSGKHPAGNVGTQIAVLDPINKGDVVWYLRPQEVLHIGRLFLTGKVDATQLVALTGSEVRRPHYFKTKTGSSIADLLKDNLNTEHVRYISGNPLTGRKIEKHGFVGFYDSQVSIIPEGDHYEFLGWALPGFKKFSHSRSFFSWLKPGAKYRLDTNYNGGERAYVMTGQFEQVFGWNIFPMQLIKAILIEDIDMMEKLGIYEVDEEDFALCEFIDTSKTEIQEIVRKGLDLMRKEMS